jgi:hypothetical protein
MMKGRLPGLECIGIPWEIGLIIYAERYAKFFQAEIYAVMTCAHEIQLHGRSEKYVSICCDSQAALKALQAVRTSPLVLLYQLRR